MVSKCYENYAKLRDENYMTDYAVSKRAGINRANFTQWRKGNTAPSYNSLEKLAKYFNVPVKYFFEG